MAAAAHVPAIPLQRRMRRAQGSGEATRDLTDIHAMAAAALGTVLSSSLPPNRFDCQVTDTARGGDQIAKQAGWPPLLQIGREDEAGNSI